MDASLTFLLKTSMAKNAKDTASLSTQIEVGISIISATHVHTCLLLALLLLIVKQMPDDTEKLKKHINMVLDRISKGAKLVRPTKIGTSKQDSVDDELDDDS